MLIDKLKEHLKNTSFEELQSEWELVNEFEGSSPTAIDLIQSWDTIYYDNGYHDLNINHEETKIINETPNYSEFFF